ncbi:MAG TPA: tetratricopeptide repeat protein [Candidatus Binatia bacterium]|nr:tetratricopeptide repeat protein [Candidatus Binatia bacterium]
MGSDRHSVFRRIVAQAGDDFDLARAALAIAQDEYPALEPEAYLARLDRLAARVRDLAGGKSDPYRMIAALNHVLFTQESFRGNRGDYYDPRNSFLSDVLERKKGIPITLSVIYTEVARRAGLPLRGVGFPGHFLVKYESNDEEIVIDPFDKGEVRTLEELQALLDELYNGKVALRPEFLAPVTNRQIIHRILNNLKGIYLSEENLAKALSAAERLVILDPASAPEIRDRGVLYLKLECFQQAINDFEAYLRLAPDASDAEDIREQLVELKKCAALH